MRKKIEYYVAENGKSPFALWLVKLDNRTRVTVYRLIQKVANGGARKSVKRLKDADGIFEMKSPYAAGLRVYFGEDGDSLIILLIGGDKKTQVRDIQKAKQYWSDYVKAK